MSKKKKANDKKKKIESRKMNEQMAVYAYLLHAFRRKNFTVLDLFFGRHIPGKCVS